ncbi:MAG TPA: M20 family metallopeptidase [Gemmatimonadaceae bacterium]|nr:M20 family metallopeptidase [Gemmatimonadaceae bacterium]
MTSALVLPLGVAALFTPADVDVLVALRRDIHAHPELALQEHETSRRLADALATIPGVDVRRVAGTGLVARVPGRDRRVPLVAVRGDIDALPIRERTGLPFASEHDGVMHACGHDVHAAWTVGAARLLARDPAPGDVLIVLQPAEEVGKGALAMLASGALDDVACIFGGHVDRRFEVGQAVADAGPLAASADTFTIELVGQGAHAARPHESADPIVGAAAVISALQTIVSRRLNPATPGVVTVGTIHAGTAPNVIPDRAALTGTVRAVEPQSRQMMLDEVRRLAESVAASHRLSARVELELGTPPLVNPARAAAWARSAAARVIGEDAVVPLGFMNLGGEDFAYYLDRMDGCFLRIGARERGGEATAAHSPRFAPAEEAIFCGAAILAECAREAGTHLARAMESTSSQG